MTYNKASKPKHNQIENIDMKDIPAFSPREIVSELDRFIIMEKIHIF